MSFKTTWPAWLIIGCVTLLLGCPPLTYPNAYTGDNDDSADDDDIWDDDTWIDDDTGDDDTGDDDTGDDDTGDDDTGPNPCSELCGSALATCVDWGSLGGTCQQICPKLPEPLVSCILDCDPPPPKENCDCVMACFN